MLIRDIVGGRGAAGQAGPPKGPVRGAGGAHRHPPEEDKCVTSDLHSRGRAASSQPSSAYPDPSERVRHSTDRHNETFNRWPMTNSTGRAVSVSGLVLVLMLFPGAMQPVTAADLSPAMPGGAETYGVPLFPSIADTDLAGVVRVVNRSGQGGQMTIAAIDDSGARVDGPALSIGPWEALQFDSWDLAYGNPEKGLATGIGIPLTGYWRLEMRSDLDLEVLS